MLSAIENAHYLGFPHGVYTPKDFRVSSNNIVKLVNFKTPPKEQREGPQGEESKDGDQNI
jgi:hypothetical protein